MSRKIYISIGRNTEEYDEWVDATGSQEHAVDGNGTNWRGRYGGGEGIGYTRSVYGWSDEEHGAWQE